MLPKDRRLTTRTEIARSLRGRRAGSAVLVVHAAPAARPGHARLGLAVGKAVGGSVVRHRVSRRVRHVFAAQLPAWDAADLDVVVRALPPAAAASSVEIADVLDAGRRRLAGRT